MHLPAIGCETAILGRFPPNDNRCADIEHWGHRADAKWCEANPNLHGRVDKELAEQFGELRFARSAAELAAAACGD